MSKNSALAMIKWLFAALILTALLRSGKLSFKDIEIFFAHPRAAAACFGLIAVIMLCAFFRWQFLLANQNIKISYGTALKLGMLGQFFSAIIPGTVGGDLVKAVYIARRFPRAKIETVTSIFLDRFLGLLAILSLGALGFLLSYTKLSLLPSSTSRHLVESLGWLLVLIAGGALSFLLLFPFFGKFLPPELPGIFTKLPASNFFATLYRVLLAYRDRVWAIWLVLLLSAGMHILNITVLYIVASTVFGPAPWGSVDLAFFVVGSVLGIAATAIPVAPMGLGVGQLAFAGIFVAIGAPSQAFGATVITGLQIVTLTLNLSGALFFATYRHEVQETQINPA